MAVSTLTVVMLSLTSRLLQKLQLSRPLLTFRFGIAAARLALARFGSKDRGTACAPKRGRAIDFGNFGYGCGTACPH